MSNRLSKMLTDEQFNRGIQIESAGNPDARAGTSTAAGLGQFLKRTWVDTGKKHYPDLVRQYGEARWADMRVGRETALLQMQMMARFWEDNAKEMRSTRDGDLYLAHFLGAGGAKKMVAADQNATAVSVAGQAAANANRSIFWHKDGTAVTVAELRAWAEGSMRKRWEKGRRKDWVTIWGSDTRTRTPRNVTNASASFRA